VHHKNPAMIIDPVALFREGLSRILQEAEFHPVWCSDRPPVRQLRTLAGQVSSLLIIGTEIDEALVQIAEVKRVHPISRVVLLLDPGSQLQLAAAIRCGVTTILPRSSSCEMLILTLKLVLDGITVIPSNLLNTLLERRQMPAVVAHITAPKIAQGGSVFEILPQRASGLSARELGVTHRLREGLSNKEIARALGITEATVKVHVKAILRKAQVRNRTQVAMWASKLGLGSGQVPLITPSAIR
jgi:two-component system, NarL family, nitrate/nitrite response regulator NarL